MFSVRTQFCLRAVGLWWVVTTPKILHQGQQAGVSIRTDGEEFIGHLKASIFSDVSPQHFLWYKLECQDWGYDLKNNTHLCFTCFSLVSLLNCSRTIRSCFLAPQPLFSARPDGGRNLIGYSDFVTSLDVIKKKYSAVLQAGRLSRSAAIKGRPEELLARKLKLYTQPAPNQDCCEHVVLR